MARAIRICGHVAIACATFCVPVAFAQQPTQSHAARIDSLIDAGQFAAADAIATADLKQHPGSAVLEFQMARIALGTRDTAAAESWAKKAVEHAPALSEAKLLLARVYLENPARYPDAETRAAALYTAVIAHDPHAAEANAELALIEYRHGDYKAAARHVGEVRGPQESAPLVEALRCGSLAGVQQRTQADAACAQLTADDRATEDDAVLAAAGLRDGKRADLIVSLFTAVRSRQPLSPAGLRWLGLAEDATGDSAAARQSLEQAYAAAPQDADLLVDLATVAERQGQGKEALGYLAHARDLRPKDAHLQALFAQQCANMGLLGEARNAMQAALSLTPDNPEYNLTMGKVTALSQDPLSAKPFLQKYHALSPADPQGVLLLGLIEYRARNFEEARPWLTQAAANPATAAEANLYLGSGDRQLGKLEEAQTFLQRSVAQNPSDAEAHAELGLIALQLHKLDDAKSELAKATALDAENYSANFGLLQLYAQTQDPRRPEQLRHFEKIKERTDALNQEAMRVVEIRRNDPPMPPQ